MSTSPATTLPTETSAEVLGAPCDPTDPALLPYSGGEIWDEARIVTRIYHHTENIVRSAYEIGRALIHTKMVLGHGRFGTWCTANLPEFEPRTLRRYMQVAEFLVNNPRLLEPAARAGIKKTLLLTTLSDDQVADVYADGLLAGSPIEDLDTIPYFELKKQVGALSGQVTQLAEDLRKKDLQLEKSKAALGEVSGALREEDEDLLGSVDKARDELADAIRKVRLALAPVFAQHERQGVGVEVRAQLMGLMEYGQTLMGLEALGARERLGEGVFTQEMLALLEQERPRASAFEVPADLMPTRLVSLPTGGRR